MFEVSMEPTKQPGYLNEYILKKFEVSMEPTKQPGFLDKHISIKFESPWNDQNNHRFQRLKILSKDLWFQPNNQGF